MRLIRSESFIHAGLTLLAISFAFSCNSTSFFSQLRQKVSILRPAFAALVA